MIRLAALIGLIATFVSSEDVTAQDRFARPRQKMLVQIAATARATAAETGRSAFKKEVMEAMAKVPRHRFVPSHLQGLAYDDRPLPIGLGQTISQPYIVALMTDLLNAKATAKILEIGTGSGYQSAVLAQLVQSVYTVEIVSELGQRAEATLRELGYANIRTRIGDGYRGWPEQAPFDGILVTAAAPEVPAALVQQLAPGGRLIIPVGGEADIQELLSIEMRPDGSASTQRTIPVRFVPLTRERVTRQNPEQPR
jgi:protein-L-isoaspartate(D-aspartate) O-methyltransferase